MSTNIKNENSTNPFEATAQVTNAVRGRGRTKAVMAALSIGCYCLAGVLYFCSQSWTFYTLYSTETTWELFWQGQMTIEIGVTFGMLALTGSILLGSLFLLLALIPWRKRSVDSKVN
ncbi:MAG: hypothetical protein NTY15_12190 [Planctomycetota bacterium]|nr:hypothetical protein [Planctomycetota bacterium]